MDRPVNLFLSHRIKNLYILWFLTFYVTFCIFFIASFSNKQKIIGLVEEMSLLVLYGSETGTSQDLAEQIWREGYRRNVPVKVVAFDDFDMNVSH